MNNRNQGFILAWLLGFMGLGRSFTYNIGCCAGNSTTIWILTVLIGAIGGIGTTIISIL